MAVVVARVKVVVIVDVRATIVSVFAVVAIGVYRSVVGNST